MDQPQTQSILSELFQNPVFYKLIVFESLNNDLFIRFMQHYKYNLNAIYIKINNLDLYDKDDKEFIFGEEVKNDEDILNRYLKFYPSPSLSEQINDGDKIFHILDIEKLYKSQPNKQFIKLINSTVSTVSTVSTDSSDSPDFNKIFSTFLSNVKKVQTDREIELDNTIQKLKINMNKDVLTFLKLRNDEDINMEYNRRFKIFLNKTPNKLLLYYNIDDDEYYQKDGDEFTLTKKGEERIDSYAYKYMFGQFTQIFNPSLSNDDIAKKMETIKNSLISGKNVFVIGYGASGAGKTSTLVYLDTVINDEHISQDGIVINICNQLSDKFDRIELSSKELYAVVNPDNPDKRRSPATDATEKTYNFIVNDGKFVSEKDFLHKNNHDNETKFNKDDPIGKVIIHMIDKDRLISGTTNNPKSSRSHALIFLKLINTKDTKSAYLIIGDFAGVENTFVCSNPEVIKKFSDIHVLKQNDNGSTRKDYMYKGEGGCKTRKTRKNRKNRKGGAAAGTAAQAVTNIEGDVDGVQQYIFDFYKPEFFKDWDCNKEMFIKIIDIIKSESKSDKSNINSQGTIDKIKGYLTEIKSISTSKENQKEKNALLIECIQKFILYINQTKTLPTITEVMNNINGLISIIYVKDINNVIIQQKIEDTLKINDTIEKLIKVTGNQVIDNINEKIGLFRDMNEQLNGFYKTGAFQKWIKALFAQNIFIEIKKNSEHLKKIFFAIYALPAINLILNEQNSAVPTQNPFNQLYSNDDNNLKNIEKCVTKITELIENNIKHILKLTKECDTRVIEGRFINNSLTELRNTIKKIISDKNKGLVIPNFIGECYNKYFYNDYFKETKIDTTKSIIIDEIIEELRVRGSDTTDFYENLIVSIFCVFNISRGANNPPPTHYIDINKLKFLFNTFKKSTSDAKIFEYLKAEVIKANQLIENFGKNLDKESTVSKIIDYKPTATNTRKIILSIEPFIKSIDNFNAPSAVGTLDFLDSIAKYNTVDNICMFQDSEKESQVVIDKYHMSELYVSESSSNNSKNNDLDFENLIVKDEKKKSADEKRLKLLSNKDAREKAAREKAAREKAAREAEEAAKEKTAREAEEAEEKAAREAEEKTAREAEEAAKEKTAREAEERIKAEAQSDALGATGESAEEAKERIKAKAQSDALRSTAVEAKGPAAGESAEAKGSAAKDLRNSTPSEQDEPDVKEDKTTQLKETAKKYNTDGLSACFELGNIYETTNIDDAIKYYEKSAPSHLDAYQKLESLYIARIKILQIEKNAENEKKISNYYYKLGLMYEYGRGGVKDPGKSEKYYNSAISVSETSINPAAYRKLGIINLNDKKEEALNTFIKGTNDAGTLIFLIIACDRIIRSNPHATNEDIEEIKETKTYYIDEGLQKNIIDIIAYNEVMSLNHDLDIAKKKIISLINETNYGDINTIRANAENENEQAQYILSLIYDTGLMKQSPDAIQSKYWYDKSLFNDYFTAKLFNDAEDDED